MKSSSEQKPGCGIFLWTGLGLLIVVTVLSLCRQPSDEEAELRKRAGFHCLDYYYGALPALENAVKATLRDPGSYEHVSTKVSPVKSDGTHGVVMRYRAKNGFGGMNIEQVVGRFRNEGCTLIDWNSRP